MSVGAVAPAIMVEGNTELIVGTGFASGVGVDPLAPQPESKSADVNITRRVCEYLTGV